MTKFSYFLGSEQWQPEDLIKHAEIAKEAGFEMLTISEHFHPWVDDYSASNFTWSTLGALANKIPELDLGTGVTTPLWIGWVTRVGCCFIDVRLGRMDLRPYGGAGDRAFARSVLVKTS